MKRYYKIIIDWIWLLLWWLALFWLMLVFKGNTCSQKSKQIIEKLDSIDSRLPLSIIADEPTNNEIRLRNNTPWTVLY